MEKAVEEALKRDKHVAVKSSWVEQCLSFLGTRQVRLPSVCAVLPRAVDRIICE